MKLYYAPGACSLADHVALAESGLSYDLARVDLRAKQVEGEGDYTAVNPKGYVPALKLDDGTVITENIAILSYLAERLGTMMPPSGISHIRALELLAYISTEVHKNFKPFFNPNSSDLEKEEAGKILAKRFGYLSEVLGEQDYLMGEELSAPDCYALVTLRWAAKNEIDLPANLAAYRTRLHARPAVQRALAEEGLA
jgi:glutathione S-transferase